MSFAVSIEMFHRLASEKMARAPAAFVRLIVLGLIGAVAFCVLDVTTRQLPQTQTHAPTPSDKPKSMPFIPPAFAPDNSNPRPSSAEVASLNAFAGKWVGKIPAAEPTAPPYKCALDLSSVRFTGFSNISYDVRLLCNDADKDKPKLRIVDTLTAKHKLRKERSGYAWTKITSWRAQKQALGGDVVLSKQDGTVVVLQKGKPNRVEVKVRESGFPPVTLSLDRPPPNHGQ